MKAPKEEKKPWKVYEESFQKYLNNRCNKKPRKPNKNSFIKLNNMGLPMFAGYAMGFGRNQMVIYFPERKKLKGWMRKFLKK